MRNQNHRRTIWLGVMCLLLAAGLRLAAFDEALVGADQTSILAAAANIASGRDLPGVGIKSSVGVMQTAVTGYLAALPLLLVHRIIAIKWFFSLLDLLALALLYRATRRAFGPLAAAAAGLLYAANPWVVEFNRWIWYQTLIPTFATLAFAAFLHLLGRRRGRRCEWMLALGLVSAALMAMVHLAAAPWAGLLFLLGAFLAWRGRLWRGFGLGLGLSAIIVAPYGLYLIQTRFADVQILLAGNGAVSQSGLNLATYRLAWELLTGAQVLTTPRDPLWAASVVAPDVAYAVIPLLLGIAVLGALYRLIRRDKRDEPSAPLAFALGWTLLAPTIFVPTSIHLQHFYLLFLFPAPYVVIAAWLGWSAPQRQTALRWMARIGLALVILLCGWWSYLWGVRIHYEHQGKLRAPTRAWLMDRTAATCQSYLEENPTGQMILLIDFEGHLSPFDWLRSWLNTDRLRVVPANVGFIRPATETCYLLGPRVTEAALAPVAEQAQPRPEMTIPAQPPWRVYCIPPRAPLPNPLARWENGLRLLETEIDGELTPGGRLQLHHTWHYRAAAEKEYHLFNHLVQGETLAAQVDGSGVPTWYWRDDDVLHTTFTLPLPDPLAPGEYRLLIGAYTWPEITRVFLESGEAAYEVRRWELP